MSNGNCLVKVTLKFWLLKYKCKAIAENCSHSTAIDDMYKMVSTHSYILPIAIPWDTLSQNFDFNLRRDHRKISYYRRDYESVDEKSLS